MIMADQKYLKFPKTKDYCQTGSKGKPKWPQEPTGLMMHPHKKVKVVYG